MNALPEKPCPPRPGWIKTRLLPILVLVLVVGIVGTVFYLWRFQPETVDRIEGLGYLGVFLISLGLNATVVLPVGNFAAMAALAAVLPPVPFLGLSLPAPLMVGLVGGFAAALGETTGYVAGYSGQAIVENKRGLYLRMEGWLRHWGMLFIFVFSIVPVVFDVVGLVTGALRFPYWKFFLACWWGRTILYVCVCFATVAGWDWLSRLIT